MKRSIDKIYESARRGFTLTELIVAVAAVVLITLGVASVFQSTTKTIRVGRASADLDTLASAIERVIRSDIENINTDGFLVIRTREIDLDGSGDNLRRADEMAFFVNGNFTTAQFSHAGGVGTHVQSRIARVYYGHGVQLGPAAAWKRGEGTYPLSDLTIALTQSGLGVPGGRNANPDNWLLMRQPVLLTHRSKTVRQYVVNPFRNFEVGDNVGTYAPLASGLVDIAAVDMSDLTSYVMTQSSDPANLTPNLLVWAGEWPDRQQVMRMAQILPHDWDANPHQWVTDERNWVSGGVSWRAEVAPTGLSRSEMMLTQSTLAAGVTSFRIEWSYDGSRWFDLNSRITANTPAPYPHRLLDAAGRPIESGLAVPVDRITVPQPQGFQTANYTINHDGNPVAYRERLFGFGLFSIDYLQDRSAWRAGPVGGPVRVRNTEMSPPENPNFFNPAMFDPDSEGEVGSMDHHQWRLVGNDLLPDRMPIPFPRLLRVTFTLTHSNGEATDVPYTFTFELPKPSRLRPTHSGMQDYYYDPYQGEP